MAVWLTAVFCPSTRNLPGWQGPCGRAENVEIPLSGRSGVLAGCCLRRSLRASSAELGKRQEMFDAMLWGNGNVLLNLRRCYAAGRLMLRLKHASAGSPEGACVMNSIPVTRGAA